MSLMTTITLSIAAAHAGEAGDDSATALSAAEAVKSVAAATEPVLARRRLAGLALAAVKGDEIAFATLGIRDAGGEPVTPDSLFYVASCTKTFTALLIGKLAEADELELDDPLRAVLPQFALADEDAAASLTLRDLLCHRLGIDCAPAVLLDAYSGEITDERFFRLLARVKPAGRCRYTNTHFTLAARAAEAVRGAKWQDLLAAELFEPLGMERTTAYASRAFADPDCAWPLQLDGGVWRRMRVKSDRTMHAAGGLCTTARDAASWIRLHLARGATPAGPLVMRETIDDALALQCEAAEGEGQIRDYSLEGYGLAWQLGRFHGERIAQHGGGYLGYSALMAFLPERGVGAVALANGSGGRVAEAATLTLLARMSGIAIEDLLGWLAQNEMQIPAPPPAPLGATEAEVGGALARFTGTYVSDDLGTFVVRANGGRLEGELGEFPFVVRVASAGAWELLFDGGGQSAAARPRLESDRMSSIELDVFGMTSRFVRAPGS